ncbi:MAG: hypothetical protein P4N24_18235 [Acidobacteriota bacterium]|nr:hypothetical protein [Acidobacteriota bacterium]
MSLFGKDNQKRMTDTLAFIEGIQGISVVQKNKFILENRNNLQISPRISLGFTLVNNKAETERRRALRALLLCVGTVRDAAINDAKQYFKNKPIDALVDGIKSYFPLTDSDENSVLRIIADPKFTMEMGAEGHNGNEFYKYTRKALMSNEVRRSGNCYGSVCLILYLGGVVSLRWLRKYGSQQGTAAPSNLFTFGPRITEPFVTEDIPKGKLLYYFRPPAGVHFTISIGNKNCVGNNNSMDAVVNWPKDKELCGDAPSTTYSTFRIAGYLKACQDDLVKHNKNRTDAYIMFASCIPKDRY